MQLEIEPSSLQGRVKIPSSKSHTLRALVFALMAEGKSTIVDFLPSPDTEAMIAAIEQLGAVVKRGETTLEVVGSPLKPASNVIDAGNSGIVLRFIGALSSLIPHYTILTGDHSIRTRRPILPLLSGLKDLGAFAESAQGNGHAPIMIRGPIKSGSAHLSGEDSQPVSALLIATSFLEGESHIHVTNPGEKPWIDLTLDWLRRFGIDIAHENYEHYLVKGRASFKGFHLRIPGDFSTAAFPIAAALVTDSSLILDNLDMEDVQGDKKVIEILIGMGAKIECDRGAKRVIVKQGGRLVGKRIDINDCIDALGVLAVVGCFAEGKTEIVGAKIARNKECDRIHALAVELKKMGAHLEEHEDGLTLYSSSLKGAHLNTHHDHRMVLALLVAALGASSSSILYGVEAASKTYSTFISDFRNMGAHLQ